MVLKKTTFAALSLLITFAASAQELAPHVTSLKQGSNLLVILMVVITAVLAFVIYAMGQALLVIVRQVMEKGKTISKHTSLLLLLLLLQQAVSAQEAGETLAAYAPNYGGLSATAFWMFVSVIAAEMISILALLLFIRRMQQELLSETTANKRSFRWREWWNSVDARFFTRAVPVAKEEDILLDHEYDGIKELDNSLPPWWKYGFILTAIFAIVYLFHFHVLGSGKNPTEEYQAAMKEAQEQLDIFNAKNKDKVDENHLELSPVGGIAAGKEIFQQVCWACHGREGEGGAGPNLTDDYWLHKGSLTDIYHSIKTGYPDKGMQAWQKQYTPKEISNIASFIKTLRGTKPANAKAPQGEIYTDEVKPMSITDSAGVVKDTIPAT